MQRWIFLFSGERPENRILILSELCASAVNMYFVPDFATAGLTLNLRLNYT